MATVEAVKGIKTPFLGGADVIECVFSPGARNGVQVEVEGFTLNNSTLTVFGLSSTDGDIKAISESLHVVVVGTSGGVVGRVSISGVVAGTYNVTFIEL